METAHAHATRRPGFEGVRRTWDAWRTSRTDRGFVRVEARFFDAYCRGGSHQWDPLEIDYAFVIRPAVREVLRTALRGGPLDTATLEAEFLAVFPDGDLRAFRANVAHLARCLADA